VQIRAALTRGTNIDIVVDAPLEIKERKTCAVVLVQVIERSATARLSSKRFEGLPAVCSRWSSVPRPSPCQYLSSMS
jgi:hypothetical protein